MAINWITLQRSAAEEAPLEAELNEALVRELLTRTRSAGLALLAVVLVLWLIIEPWSAGLVSLFIALAGFTVLRMVGSVWFERRPRERFHTMHAFIWFALMSALIGMTLGAIVLTAYPQIPPLSVALCSVCIVGINSAALVSLSSSPLVYLLYFGSNMTAVTIVAFLHPLPGLELAFQVMQVMYSAALIAMMRTVHRSLRSSLVVRLRLASSVEQLRYTQAKLVEASRQAGRADVATELLHSVGNVLNSVNVSATLVSEIIGRSKTNNLSKVVAILMQHRDNLGQFLRDDPRGQKLPEYFTQLVKVVEHDNTTVKAELTSLTRHIDHIKVLVASQHAQARPSHLVETFDVHEMLDDALQLSASYDRHVIEVERRFEAFPPVTLDRHKVLHVLIILLANARDAVMTRPEGERRIVVHARRGQAGELEVTVEDNGCGIDPGNLDKIFALGFTTKPTGHGLALHYGACAARELKGQLTARSAGLGHGASFVLAVPLEAPPAPPGPPGAPGPTGPPGPKERPRPSTQLPDAAP